MIKHHPKEPAGALAGWLAGMALLVCCCAGSVALAQEYPARPVKIIMPYGPGGVSDLSARLLAQRLSDSMRQQVIVENRPGAGGIVATEAALKSEPDGYTMMWLGSGHAVSVSLMKSLPYDLARDFAPISTVGFYSLALVVNADSPLRSVAALVAFAKANPDRFNIGTLWIGTTNSLAAELFKSMAGLGTQVVPFKSSPDLLNAIRGNQVQAIFEFISPVLPHIRSGGLRALAVTSDRRYADLPDVPTMGESGLAGYKLSAWDGLAVPAKTPRNVVERLSKEINAAIANPELKQRLRDMGIDAQASTPEGLRDLLAADIAKYKSLIEVAKIERQ